jgi:hypothetical protein
MKMYWKGSGQKFYVGKGINLKLNWYQTPDGGMLYHISSYKEFRDILICQTAPIQPTAVGAKNDFPFLRRM